jgi:hypothetical protein
MRCKWASAWITASTLEFKSCEKLPQELVGLGGEPGMAIELSRHGTELPARKPNCGENPMLSWRHS